MKRICLFVCLCVVVSLGAQDSPDINPFIRGDVNLDARVGIADAVQLVDALFGAGRLDCPDAADADDDGSVNVTDALSILAFLFQGGAMPAPWPGCGLDPTLDLSCYCQATYCPAFSE